MIDEILVKSDLSHPDGISIVLIDRWERHGVVEDMRSLVMKSNGLSAFHTP